MEKYNLVMKLTSITLPLVKSKPSIRPQINFIISNKLLNNHFVQKNLIGPYSVHPTLYYKPYKKKKLHYNFFSVTTVIHLILR